MWVIERNFERLRTRWITFADIRKALEPPMAPIGREAGRAINRVDVSFPSGASAFGSDLLQPGGSFYHTFDKPGTYHYVCVVHETEGMKGTVIVRPGTVLASNKE